MGLAPPRDVLAGVSREEGGGHGHITVSGANRAPPSKKNKNSHSRYFLRERSSRGYRIFYGHCFYYVMYIQVYTKYLGW